MGKGKDIRKVQDVPTERGLVLNNIILVIILAVITGGGYLFFDTATNWAETFSHKFDALATVVVDNSTNDKLMRAELVNIREKIREDRADINKALLDLASRTNKRWNKDDQENFCKSMEKKNESLGFRCGDIIHKREW